MKERHSDLKLWAYRKHFQELELKEIKRLDKTKKELKRIRKNLKELKDAIFQAR